MPPPSGRLHHHDRLRSVSTRLLRRGRVLPVRGQGESRRTRAAETKGVLLKRTHPPLLHTIIAEDSGGSCAAGRLPDHRATSIGWLVPHPRPGYPTELGRVDDAADPAIQERVLSVGYVKLYKIVTKFNA